jgi:hypothetical protein
MGLVISTVALLPSAYYWKGLETDSDCGVIDHCHFLMTGPESSNAAFGEKFLQIANYVEFRPRAAKYFDSRFDVHRKDISAINSSHIALNLLEV